MYGERYDRGDERGDHVYPRYRSAGSFYGTASVPRAPERVSERPPPASPAPEWPPRPPATAEWPPRQPATPEWPPRRAETPEWPPQGRATHRRAVLDDEDPPARRRAPAQTKRKQMPLWQEMPLLLIVAFCLAVLIRTFLLQAFYIPSGSMENTLLVGDRVLVNKVIYDMREPRRGEVVVFKGTNAWVPEVRDQPDTGFLAKLGSTLGDLVGVSRPGEKDFIKRVIGLPGDRVKCCDPQGRVLLNGRPLDEPYVLQNSPLNAPPNARECRSRRFDEVVVQSGNMFVMGDHRNVSQDSRCQGQVPIENAIGRAFIIVWPNKRWDSLSIPSTFDNIPVAYAPGMPTHANPQLVGSGEPWTPGPFGIIVPILLTSAFSARSRQHISGWHRRLPE